MKQRSTHRATMLHRLISHATAIAIILIATETFSSGTPIALDNQATVTANPEKRPYLSPAIMKFPLSTWVGPGDMIRIKAYPDTTSFITGDYTILDSGYVVLPVLGSVQVTAMSIDGLGRHLTDAYARYMAYPNVQVEPLIRIMLLGGFLHPGAYLANPLHPLSRALSYAGGTVRDDGLKLLRWERGGGVLRKNLTAEIENSKSLWELGFKSNDQVCVTLRTRPDILPVITFITSTIVASATLFIAFEAYSGGLSR